MRKAVYSLLALLLVGCSTPNIKPGDTSLDEKQGILVTRILTNIEHGSALIHHKDQVTPSAKFENIKAPEELKVIKIEPGKARFSRIYLQNLETWRDSKGYFTVESGKITYIGDFVIEWQNNNGRLGVITLHIDREDETIGQAKLIYPELFTKYEYVKSIPKIELKNVDGYKSVEEIEHLKKKQETMEKAIEEYVNKSKDNN